MTVTALAQQEGITSATLYKWRDQARIEGKSVPGSNKKTTQWSAQARFATLVETATFNEVELSEYCRQKGLYPEQILEWKQSFINNGEQNQNTADKTLLKQQTKEIKLLKKALNRKEKALAEAAALLVLRKKFNQYYGLEEVEED